MIKFSINRLRLFNRLINYLLATLILTRRKLINTYFIFLGQFWSLNLKDLQVSIRCLSLSTLYFLTQLCTFIPGLCLLGAADENAILDIRIRIFIYIFYLLQFLKPVFYLIFDSNLRKDSWNFVVSPFSGKEDRSVPFML